MEDAQKLKIAETILEVNGLLPNYRRSIKSIAQGNAYRKAFESDSRISKWNLIGFYTNKKDQVKETNVYLTGMRHRENRKIVQVSKNADLSNAYTIDLERFKGRVYAKGQSWDYGI